MTRLSISETTTFRWSFEDDVREYAMAGMSAIGLWRHKLSDYGTERARRLLDEAHLTPSHLSWAGGFTGSDGRSHCESVEDAAEAIQIAGALDCPTLLIYSGPRGGHTGNHARRLFLSALTELAPRAANAGVTLAIEPMHPGCAADWTFLTSLDETLCLLQAINSPHVKMVLDTYHLGHEARLIERLAAIVPQIAIVQLGDGRKPPRGEQNRCRLGEGAAPLREIIQALETYGYCGYYDVELFGEDLEIADYRSLLKHAREAYERLIAGALPQADSSTC